MANLKNVIYLSNSDYETLVTTGTVTINGTTLTYDDSNVYITPEEIATTTENGLMSSSDKTKLDSISSQTAYTAKGSATKVPQITTNSYGQVTSITEVTITQPTTTSQLTNNSNFVSGTGLDSNYIVVGNGNGTVKKGDYTISELKDIAEGKTDTYVIATKACITGTEDQQTGNFSGVSQILTAPSGGTSLDLTAMNVGDNIYIKETEVPDYWVSSKSTSNNVTTLELSKLETSKVDLTNYAPKSHATNATTYGVGTTTNYGHVKLKTGDMVALDYEDGVAASISHSHSDYYPAANPNGYISGITSTMVTNALGYTPGTSNFIGYSSSNKLSTDYINNVAGWTSNSGTMTGVTAGAGLNTTSNDTTTDGGTISNSGTLYLTKSGVTAGTYQGITVDKYGRVTSASNQGYGTYSKPSGGIPSTDLADSYLKLDGTTTMTGALQLQATGNNQSNIGSNGIRWNSTSLPEQTSPQYFCVIDGFANGGRQKWASLANVKSALGVPSAVTESTVSGWGFTKNVGTVTEVSAGTGLNISGTATVSPTVNVDSNYKLQTTQEWKNSSIYSVVSGITTTAGNASSGSYLSVKWTVDDVEGITEPYDGMKILVRIPLAGVGTAGVVLSIDGGTTYHPVAYNVNTALTTHYPVNTNKVFVYNATQKMNGYLTSNTVTNITGVWQGESNYDSNTTITYGTLAYYFRPYAAQAIYRYKFVMLDDDNRLVPLTTTNVSSGDSVTTNQTPTALSFRPDKIYWYNATATINAGSVVGGNTLVDIGYNANNTTNGGMARCNFNAEVPAYRMIYLCGTYNTTTGLFSLRGGGTAGSTAYYTFVPTNSANITLSSYFTSGYDYILLGGTYSSATYIHLRDDHPMYHFDGTNLVPYDTWNENRIEALIPNNYITSITSTDITNALGYTPGTSNFTGYTSSNKLSTNYINNVAGWTANAGTVTSVTAGDGLVIAEDETVNPIVCIDSDYKLPTTTEWSSVATNVAKTNADNSFSVAQTFKDITLYSASGDSPRLTFQRGTLTDTYNDWSLYDSGGLLYIQQRGSGSSSWETRATFTQSAANFAGTLQQGGVNVVTTSDSQALTNKTYNGYTLGAACAKALASSISSTDTGLVTAAQVAGALANVSGGGLNVLQADYLYDIDEGDWATSVTSEQHDAIILADVLAVTDDGSQITYFYKVDVEQANSGDTYVFEGVYSSGINLRLSFNSTNDVDSQYIQTATYRHTLSYSATSISSGTFSGSGKLIVINNSKSAINLWSANVAKGAVITHLNANNNQTGAAFYLGTMSVYGNMRGPMFLVVSGFNATSGTFSSMQVLEMNGLTISSDVVEEI